jgi:N-acetylneuraminate synthase/sialic acid synthase
MRNLYFIAELGQNHQGDIKIAKQMIDSLVGSGVHAVKTAKRDIDTCLTDEQKNMPYSGPHSFGKTYYEHRKALELTKDEFVDLKNYAELKGFDFISSFTDLPSFFFLREIGLEKIKIASSRVTDIRLLTQVELNFKGTVFMSTGMSTISDIDKMIDIFGKNEKCLMQCTSVYPCENRLLNLSVLKLYKKLFKNKVDVFGFSGHHAGIAPDVLAYFMGAKVIERHYTLNRSWKGSDHAASLGIEGINKIIKYIYECQEAIGKPEKCVLPEEIPTIKKLRGDLL